MLMLNKIIAKIISVIFKKRLGLILHFVIISWLYKYIATGLITLIMSFGDKIISPERKAEIDLITKNNPTAIFKIPDISIIIILIIIIYISIIFVPVFFTAKAKHIYYGKVLHQKELSN